MPYLTRPLDLSGAIILACYVGVSGPRRKALIEAGRPVPADIAINALVDTGASCTCVDPSILAQLDISPTGSALMHTPSTGAVPHNVDQFDISLRISARYPQDALLRPVLPVVSAELFDSQGFEVLLGRDILKDCLLIFDGKAGSYSLAY